MHADVNDEAEAVRSSQRRISGRRSAGTFRSKVRFGSAIYGTSLPQPQNQKKKNATKREEEVLLAIAKESDVWI